MSAFACVCACVRVCVRACGRAGGRAGLYLRAGCPFLFSSHLCVCVRVVSFSAALYDIANILDTGLDRETLSILVGLCETGVNPEALAAVVKELQREATKVAGQAN